mgnify:CR=1 FL=1
MSIATLWPDDISREVSLLYGFVVQLIAGADGHLSLAERELFYAQAQSRNIPGDILNEWKKYDWQEGDVDKLIAELKPHLSLKLARLLIYDAIRIAGADASYPLEEQDAVRQAAEILGVSEKLVAEMEILASLEKNVEDLKRMVFFST